MPKKRSHGGEQEYIPAGNGLASGTYASDDGNNSYHTGGQNTDKVPPRHFKKFSKDANKDKEKKDGGNQIKPKEQEAKGLYTPKKQYTEQDIKNLIQQRMGIFKQTENVLKVFEQLNGENLNPDLKGLVLDAWDSGKYRIVARKGGKGYYNYFYNEIHFASYDEGYGYANAQTLFHETGHAIDHSYKGGLWSKDYISKKYGKSLIEMKNEELNEFLQNGGYDKLLEEKKVDETEVSNEVEKYRQKYENLVNVVNNVIIEQDNFLENNQRYVELNKQLKELRELRDTGNLTITQFADKRIPIDAEIKEIKDSFPMNDILDTTREARDKAWTEYGDAYGRLTGEKINQKYMDISDMLQAIDYQYKFCGGHTKDYFERGFFAEDNKATECFAEIQGAMGTNPKSFELLQRYIPKTIEIYKEIVGELNNGK